VVSVVADEKKKSSAPPPPVLVIEEVDAHFNKQFSTLLLLGTVFGANIGSCGNVSGSSANHVLQNTIDSYFNSGETKLNYSNWLFFNFPIMMTNAVITGYYLNWYFLRGTKGSVGYKNVTERAKRTTLQKKYDSLPNLNFGGYAILVLALAQELFWFMENPLVHVGVGWSSIDFMKQNYIKNGFISRTTMSMGMALIFLVFPRDLNTLSDLLKGKTPKGPSPALVDWEEALADMHFGIILLMGGGFALALGIKESKLVKVFRDGLEVLLSPNCPVRIAPAMSIIIVSILSEFISNTPAVLVLTPLFIEIAWLNNLNPLYLSFPSGIAFASALLVPVGNPSIALLFDTAFVSKMDLLKTGLVVKLIFLVSIIFYTYTWGYYVIFDFETNKSSPNPWNPEIEII